MRVWQSIWLLKSLLLDLLCQSRISSGIVAVRKTLVNVCRREECKKDSFWESNGQNRSGGKMPISSQLVTLIFESHVHARRDSLCMT